MEDIADSEQICVVLGAGASYDVATEGNKQLIPASRPPLANELFNLEAKSQYQDILEQYPGAGFLASYLGATIAKHPTALETELRKLAYSENPQVNKYFAQIPMYLQHLISYTTLTYVSRPGAYDSLLIQLFDQPEPHRVLFVVMNYDTLLESSVQDFGGIQVNNKDDYFAGAIKVLKPHGSINWWSVLSGDREEYNRENITWEKVKSGLEGDFVIRPVSTNKAVWGMHLEQSDALWEKYAEQRPFFPLITAPIASKSIADFVCPDEHTIEAKEFLTTCTKFLIVGSSGWDTDLLEFLSSTLTTPVDMVHLVNPGHPDTVDEVKKRYTAGVSAFAEADSQSRFSVHRKDFTEYLKDSGVGNLLNGDQ